jgi:hypothetical protein
MFIMSPFGMPAMGLLESPDVDAPDAAAARGAIPNAILDISSSCCGVRFAICSICAEDGHTWM